MRRAVRICGLAALSLVLSGCAIHHPYEGQQGLKTQVNLHPALGYEMKSLPPGTTWQDVGTISDGELYKPIDTVLTVDDGGYFNGTRYEAELVVKGNDVVGLFVPHNHKFVQAKQPVSNCLTDLTGVNQ